MGLGVHTHHGVIEIGNLGMRIAHLDLGKPAQRAVGVLYLHGRAVEHQLSRQPRQLRPGQFARLLKRRGHIGVVHVAHLRGNAEFAQAGFLEREIVQIALHAELHARGRAGVDGIAHIVARVLGDGLRQIAVHARAVGARGRARQLQHAGKARRRRRLARIGRAPCDARLARRIRIGELHILRIYRNSIPVDLPVHLRRQLLHGNDGVFEHAGEYQRTIAHPQRRMPARLGERELHARALHAGHGHILLTTATHRCAPRAQGQVFDQPVGLVLLRCVERPVPSGLHVARHAARAQLAQQVMHGRLQRQALGDLREHRQMQLAGAQLAMLGLARLLVCARTGVAKEQRGVGPAQAVVRHEGEVLDAGLEAVVELLRAHAPLHRAQRQRLQLVAQRGPHLLQRQVRHAAHHLAAPHIYPGAHRATALAHGEGAQVGIFVDARHISVGQVGIKLAAPVLPAAAAHRQNGLAEHAAQ
ncbi:hypothetical protein SDC9_121715 [bioreactor metagenome]|uniref:Uncharacterized protein n=1 Tax=bioreactor metagenome TaxID=1076179 RepID=A0A645CCN3_9ZZZZ